eukprot:10517920-Prorocentrum_lima.AAC.1
MIELYLVQDPRLIARVAHDAAGGAHCNWQISDVVAKCDVAKVDTGVADTHAKEGQFHCI